MKRFIIQDELSNPTVPRQILHLMNIESGRYDKRVLKAGDTSPAGEFYGILQFLEDTVLEKITDACIIPEEEQDKALIGGYKRAERLSGRLTNIKVTSGKVLCFRYNEK